MSEAAPVERIACTVGGGTFDRDCTIDRSVTPQGTLLTIRHNDGGFRRLIVSTDGRAVSAADGALPAQVVARDAKMVEVAIADARYRIPLTR